MRKKFFIGVFALAVMGFIALGVQKSFNNNAEISQLTLENVEALAYGEEPEVPGDQGGGGGSCPGGSCTSESQGCIACCPAGKSPFCSIYGCTCIKD